MSRTLPSPPIQRPTYIHFVDDRIGDFRDKSHADGFLNYLNSLTDDLQYTIEYPSHGHPHTRRQVTSVYRKPTHTNLYARYNSCAPLPPKTVLSDPLQDELTSYALPNTYKNNWTQSTQPPYKMDTPLTESNASWTVSNKY